MSALGWKLPRPNRGESVTLEPVLSAYITKMFAPDMPRFPCPRDSHCLDEGPWIWKKMSPLPLDAVFSGTLTL